MQSSSHDVTSALRYALSRQDTHVTEKELCNVNQTASHRIVAASPEHLFEVLTNYPAYPQSNPNVVSARVIHRDDQTAEVEAERKTLIGPKVRFTDTFAPRPLLQFSRRYANNPTAKSLWTVDPAFNGQSYFTISAEMTLPFFQGIVMRPLLKRMFYKINFPPFIHAGALMP